jgi:hypothetical protein
MGISGDYAPSEEIFRMGFDLFCQKHEQILEHQPAGRALITLGTRLWREALSAAETTQSEDDDNSEEKDWTPEIVSGALESVTKRCAYWIRRSRWLCLLSESTLAWEVRNDPGQIICLVFNRGDIIDRRSASVRSTLPLSPGYSTPFRDRQHHFNINTYDRLRVVTTELRRLISEDRWLRLRLGPKSILRPAELARALRWI